MRTRYVTRTIATKTITFNGYNTVTKEINEFKRSLPAKVKEENLEKELQKLLKADDETPNIKVLDIVTVESTEVKYSMKEDDFIAHALVVPATVSTETETETNN